MQPTAAENQPAIPAWKSPWVIAWIALVVTVLGVNATMVYLALATNPGLVVEDYYERGQHYERTMLSERARDPGWLLSADFPKQINAGERTRIRFFVVDEAGQPVTPDDVELFIYRPSNAARDFSMPMQAEGPGRYVAEVSFPLLGVWDALVAARNADDEYQVARRVIVHPPRLVADSP